MPPSFSVTGGRPLKGTIRPAGNKNAALPILAATLLADGPCRLDNVPHIRDVETMLELLAHLGATVTWTGPNSVDVDAARAEPRELGPGLGARIRASILLGGPVLARFGRVGLPPPGGDVIGRRRVDTHFLALERLGATVTVGTSYQVEAKRLAGADIFLDEPSVTATENALMAAVAARGTTTLRNAACEPHVQDLARFLATLAGVPGRPDVDRDRGRVAVRRAAAGVRKTVRVAPLLRGQAHRDGGAHRTVRPASRRDRRALALAGGRGRKPRHPGRDGDAARGPRGSGRVGDPQHRSDRAGLRADRRAAAGPGGADRAAGGTARPAERETVMPVTFRPPDRPSASPTLPREQPVGDSAVPRMELREWAERYGVVAGLTTRGRGFSLGLWSEENVGQVMTRWRAVRAAFGPRFPGLVLSHQIHGTAVTWHRASPAGWLILDGIDGHATGATGLLLTVTVADCIPVYLVAPDKRVVALLHAGWRGTVGRILERGVELVKREAFVRAEDIVMHCGTGICGACYEVGSEVQSQLSGHAETEPGRVDLRQVLVAQGRALGLTQISASPWCSAHDRDQFFSHRASGGRDGRMIAYLGLPLAAA